MTWRIAAAMCRLNNVKETTEEVHKRVISLSLSQLSLVSYFCMLQFMLVLGRWRRTSQNLLQNKNKRWLGVEQVCSRVWGFNFTVWMMLQKIDHLQAELLRLKEAANRHSHNSRSSPFHVLSNGFAKVHHVFSAGSL